MHENSSSRGSQSLLLHLAPQKDSNWYSVGGLYSECTLVPPKSELKTLPTFGALLLLVGIIPSTSAGAEVAVEVQVCGQHQ